MDRIRWEKVRRVRREIARGTYVTEEKLRVTVDELLKNAPLGEPVVDDPKTLGDFMGVPREAQHFIPLYLGRSTAQSTEDET